MKMGIYKNVIARSEASLPQRKQGKQSLHPT